MSFLGVLKFMTMAIISVLAIGVLVLQMLPARSIGNHWAVITDQPMQVSEGRYGVGAWRFARLDSGQEGTLRMPMGEAIPEPGTRLCVEAVQPGFGRLMRFRRMNDLGCGSEAQD